MPPLAPVTQSYNSRITEQQQREGIEYLRKRALGQIQEPTRQQQIEELREKFTDQPQKSTLVTATIADSGTSKSPQTTDVKPLRIEKKPDYTDQPPKRFERELKPAINEIRRNLIPFGKESKYGLIGEKGIGVFYTKAIEKPLTYVGKPKDYQKVTYKTGDPLGKLTISTQPPKTETASPYEIRERIIKQEYEKSGLKYKGQPIETLPDEISYDVITGVEKEITPKAQQELDKKAKELQKEFQKRVDEGADYNIVSSNYNLALSQEEKRINEKAQEEAQKLADERLKERLNKVDYQRLQFLSQQRGKEAISPTIPKLRTGINVLETSAIVGSLAFGGGLASQATFNYLLSKAQLNAIDYTKDFKRFSTKQKILGGLSVGLDVGFAVYSGNIASKKIYSEWRKAIYQDFYDTKFRTDAIKYRYGDTQTFRQITRKKVPNLRYFETSSIRTTPSASQLSKRQSLRTISLRSQYQVSEKVKGFTPYDEWYKNTFRGVVTTTQKLPKTPITNRYLYEVSGKRSIKFFDPEYEKYLKTIETFKGSGYLSNVKKGKLYVGVDSARITYNNVISGLGTGYVKINRVTTFGGKLLEKTTKTRFLDPFLSSARKIQGEKYIYYELRGGANLKRYLPKSFKLGEVSTKVRSNYDIYGYLKGQKLKPKLKGYEVFGKGKPTGRPLQIQPYPKPPYTEYPLSITKPTKIISSDSGGLSINNIIKKTKPQQSVTTYTIEEGQPLSLNINEIIQKQLSLGVYAKPTPIIKTQTKTIPYLSFQQATGQLLANEQKATQKPRITTKVKVLTLAQQGQIQTPRTSQDIFSAVSVRQDIKTNQQQIQEQVLDQVLETPNLPLTPTIPINRIRPTIRTPFFAFPDIPIPQLNVRSRSRVYKGARRKKRYVPSPTAIFLGLYGKVKKGRKYTGVEFRPYPIELLKKQKRRKKEYAIFGI